MATIIDRLVTEFRWDTDLKTVDKLDKRVDQVKAKLNSLSDRAGAAGRVVSVAGGAATAAFALASKAAIDWESDFTGVRKTVNATDEEFDALEKSLRAMAKSDIPANVGQLANIAEAAGQLGIQTPAIAGFVEVIAMLGETTNLAAEQGATELARLANITQMPQDRFDRLGSTVVALGNNFATTEAEIVGMALRFAASAKVAGLTESQMLAVSAAASSVGLELEAGGTAIDRIFAEMEKAVQTGGPELEAFARTAGMAGGEFAGVFKHRGAAAAFQEFVRGLGQMSAAGENVHPVLEELGFDNVRIRRTVLSLASAGDLLTETLKLGNEAWEENTALTREAELRFGTAASRIQFFKNRLYDMRITIGGLLVPTFLDLLDKVEPAVDWLSKFAEEHPVLVKNVALASVAVLGLGGALLFVSGVAKLAAFAVGGFQVLMGVVALATGLWNSSLLILQLRLWGITAAQWAANAAMWANPIVLIVAGIIALVAALAVAAYFIYRFRDAIGGFALRVWRWIKERVTGAFQDVWEWLKTNWPLLLGILLGPFGLAIGAFIRWRHQIIGFFKGLVDSAFGAGKGLIEAFLDGMMSMAKKLWDGVSGVFGKVRDFLPFSDAKRGPLSDLSDSGEALIRTLQRGINAADGLSIPHLGSLAAPLTAGPLPPLAAAGGGGITLELTIEQLQVIANESTAPGIARDIAGELRTQVRQLVEEVDSVIEA